MRTKIPPWQFVWYLLSLFLLFVVIGQLGQLEKISEVVQTGNPVFLVPAALIQVVVLINQAAWFQALYAISGVAERMPFLARLVSASTFAALVTPTAAIGGMAFFIQAQRQRGIATGKSLFSTMIYWLIDYLVVALILIIGLTMLFLRHDLTYVQVVAAALMGVLLLVFVTFLIITVEAPGIPVLIARWLSGVVNRIVRQFNRSIDPDRAERVITEFRNNLYLVMRQRNHLTRPLIHALLTHFLYLSTLLLVFLSYNVPLNVATLISSYALIVLFTIVSLTPAGLGFVETIGVLALSSQQVPTHQAVVIILTYRLFTYWLPLAAGYINARLINAQFRTPTK